MSRLLNAITNLVAISGVVVLVACSAVGPDFEAPSVGVQAVWGSAAVAEASATEKSSLAFAPSL
jgi:hypothetical protein